MATVRHKLKDMALNSIEDARFALINHEGTGSTIVFLEEAIDLLKCERDWRLKNPTVGNSPWDPR